MANTIAFSKNANGAIAVAINGGVPRTLAKPNNITIKQFSNGSGVIIKKTDESWRQHVSLTDTVSEDGITTSPYANLTALVTDMTLYFS